MSKPRFETITSVLSALGLAIRVVPLGEGVTAIDEVAGKMPVEAPAKA